MVVGNERVWKIVKQWEVLTVGETMVVFIPEQKQLLRYVDRFKKGIAGAESNVAIGESKLGHTSCCRLYTSNYSSSFFTIPICKGIYIIIF